MCSACTSSSPPAVNSAAEQSARSLMLGLYDARRSTAPISSAMPVRRAISTCSDAGSSVIAHHVRGVAGSTRRAARGRRASLGDPHGAVGLGDDRGPDHRVALDHRELLESQRRGAASRAPGARRPPRAPTVAANPLRRSCSAWKPSTVATRSSWLCPAYRQSSAVVTSTSTPRCPPRPGRGPPRRGQRARPRSRRGRRARATTARRRARAASTGARRRRTRRRAAGTTTARMPSASAIAHAWSGPAPPNATSASSRGSTPCATVTARTASSIAASTTATTPSAVTPARRSASAAAARSSRPRSGNAAVASMRPSDEVGVGDRGLGAAPPVADRARRPPRALGPDDERAAGVEPGDRAATRADGVDVEGGQADRVAGHDQRRRRFGHAAPHQADVRARAAHVERDGVGEPARGGQRRRGAHPRGRAREQEGRRELRGTRHRDQPAGRRHHEHLAGEGNEGQRGTRGTRRAAARWRPS